MSSINELTSINFRELVQNKQVSNAVEKPTKDFGATISDFLKAVNQSQKESAQKVADVIQGKSENLHEAMAMLEESKLSFQLMLEIRNKLLDSYKEIERMQV
jgi:flagellar hook-basal body complex protein FliE